MKEQKKDSFSQDQGVSAEVIGQFSDAQKQELQIIAFQIIKSKGLDPKKREDWEDGLTLVGDCLKRGLKQESRIWFTPTEKVSSVFTRGLNYRKDTIDRLKKYQANANLLHYVTTEEINQIQNLSSLTTDFSQAETLLSTFRKKDGDITKFHTYLFDESPLASQARTLKGEMLNTRQRQAEDPAWRDNSRLYSNFLVHLALYRRPGLTIELEDIAALNDLWRDSSVKDRAINDLIEALRGQAKNLNLSEEAVADYTQGVLNLITSEFGQVVTLEAIANSPHFIFPVKDLDKAQLDIQRETKKIIEHTVIVPRSKIKMAEKKLRALDFLFSALDSGKENASKKLSKFLDKIDGTELLYLLRFGGNPIMDNELIESASFDTFIEALNLAYAEVVKFEDGQPVKELSMPGIELTKRKISGTVIFKLMDDQFDQEGVEFATAIGKLPIGCLGDFLVTFDHGILTSDQVEAILKLDEEKWLQICLEREIYIPINLNQLMVAEFAFSPGSENLEYYLTKLPENMRQVLADKLRRTITF